MFFLDPCRGRSAQAQPHWALRRRLVGGITLGPRLRRTQLRHPAPAPSSGTQLRHPAPVRSRQRPPPPVPLPAWRATGPTPRRSCISTRAESAPCARVRRICIPKRAGMHLRRAGCPPGGQGRVPPGAWEQPARAGSPRGVCPPVSGRARQHRAACRPCARARRPAPGHGASALPATGCAWPRRGGAFGGRCAWARRECGGA